MKVLVILDHEVIPIPLPGSSLRPFNDEIDNHETNDKEDVDNCCDEESEDDFNVENEDTINSDSDNDEATQYAKYFYCKGCSFEIHQRGLINAREEMGQGMLPEVSIAREDDNIIDKNAIAIFVNSKTRN